MKKKILFLIGVSIAACFEVHSQIVSIETARKVAENFFLAQATYDSSNKVIVKSWGNKERPTMYAISTPNRWVLIAGDRRAQPILAYSDDSKGTFPETEDMPPAMLELLEWYSSQIDTLRVRNDEREFDYRWNIYLGNDIPTIRAQNTVVVDKLLVRNGNENEWGQSNNNSDWVHADITKSYNKFCPYLITESDSCYTVVGCVAVATSQVMWYWQWPYASIVYDDNHSQLLRNYDWDLMPQGLYNSTPLEKIDMTTTLLHDVGVSLNMNYGCEGSSTSISNVITTLQNHFGYHTDTVRHREYYSNDSWLNMIKSELDNHRPVCYSGYRNVSKGLKKGHCFVVDGYDSDNLFHINMGHKGLGNHYYNLSTMTYNIQQSMITNIHPSYPSCTAVTNPISFIWFTNTSYILPYLVLQNGGAITLENRTIASGKYISVISGDYIRLNNGFKVENGAFAYFDVQDMHCDDNLTDNYTLLSNQEQMPVKKSEKIEQPEETQPQKILRDGQIFILHDGKTYTLTGQEVK